MIKPDIFHQGCAFGPGGKAEAMGAVALRFAIQFQKKEEPTIAEVCEVCEDNSTCPVSRVKRIDIDG